MERLPAGWEVENPRLNEEEQSGTQSENPWEFDHMEIRDDRIDLDELCAALGERDEDDPPPPAPALEGRELAAAVRRELLEDRRLDQRAAVVRLGEDDETVDAAS